MEDAGERSHQAAAGSHEGKETERDVVYESRRGGKREKRDSSVSTAVYRSKQEEEEEGEPDLDIGEKEV